MLDALVVSLLVAVAFLLACYKETDNDIWWHLAGGEWILREGRIPDLDPFTFASAERRWIDLHWLFEVAAALAYRAAAMPGVVLFAATLSATTMALVTTMRKPRWPLPLVIACWAPALMLIGWRLPPRPELGTLVFLALFLAVLHRLEERPKLVWILPAVQVLWVNTHGLFVLGPVVVALYLVARAVQEFRTGLPPGRLTGSQRCPRASNRPNGSDHSSGPNAIAAPAGAVGYRLNEGCHTPTDWKVAGSAFLLVIVACLINPYFVRGALFPFELFPKIVSSQNVYKSSIGEFTSLGAWARSPDLPGAGSAYFCLTYFLLLLTPASFLLPAVWGATLPVERTAAKSRDIAADRRIWWWFALAFAVGLIVASTLSLPGRPMRGWWNLGRYAPAGWLALGGAGAFALRANGRAIRTSLAASIAMAGWTVSLRANLFGRDDLLGISGHAVWLVAAVAVAGFVRSRAVVSANVQNSHEFCYLDRLLLLGAFGYLAMQAVRNGPLFGLVAGTVLASNLGDWIAEVNRRGANGRSHAWINCVVRLATAGALVIWICAIVSGDYHRWTRQRREFGLDEAPFISAHGAARFAGQAGLPERAVCFNLGQAGVYSFHSGPEHKPFIDARLELPSEDDFRQYLALESELNRGGPAWPKMLRDLGDPLLLILHLSDSAAEAPLLSHPDWRCVFFDAVGAVFVSRRQPGLEEEYPTVDFAERHFTTKNSAPHPELLRASFQESLALHRIGLGFSSASTAESTSISLAALGLAMRAVADEPGSSAAWKLLADCYAAWARQRGTDLPTDELWNPTRHLAWAQAAYCARRALETPPRDPDALSTLYSVYAATGLADAQLAVGLSLLNDPSTTIDRREEIDRLRRTVEQTVMQQGNSPDVNSAGAIAFSLRSGLPMLAAHRYADLPPANRNSLGWDGARSAAAAFLRLGQPAEARAILEAASEVPSESLRRCRIAETYLVEQDFMRAEELLRQALAADPWLADAWWALATLQAQQGNADAAYENCQRGLQLDLDPGARSDLASLKTLVTRLRPSR